MIFKSPATGGFDVQLEFEDFHYTVTALTWHSHYRDRDQAEWCVRWLFSPFYRVVEEWCESTLMGGWLERWMPQGWEPIEAWVSQDAPTHLRGGTSFTVIRWQQDVASPPDYRAFVPGVTLDANGLPPDLNLGKSITTSTESELLRVPGVVKLLDQFT